MLGWHFLPADMRLTNGDGRLAEVGKTLTAYGGSPCACISGMHASAAPSSAARFKRGPVITRVRVWGALDVEPDKFAGQHRRVLWARRVTRADLSELIRSMGFPRTLARDSIVDSLYQLSCWDAPLFDWAVARWARMNGATSVRSTRRPFAEDDLLAVIPDRTVIPEREAARRLGVPLERLQHIAFTSGRISRVYARNDTYVLIRLDRRR